MLMRGAIVNIFNIHKSIVSKAIFNLKRKYHFTSHS
jgi:hypothetical protein